jgi:hypothetical protein
MGRRIVAGARDPAEHLARFPLRKHHANPVPRDPIEIIDQEAARLSQELGGRWAEAKQFGSSSAEPSW